MSCFESNKMNLQFVKIRKNKYEFEKYLKKQLKSFLITEDRNIKEVKTFIDRIVVEYINSFTQNYMVVSFKTNEEAEIYCASIQSSDSCSKRHSSDSIYIEKIQDIIKNYRDKIETKFNADFVRVDKLLTSNVFIYKIKSGHYIYDTAKLLLEIENQNVKRIYDKDFQIKPLSKLNNIEKEILIKTLIIQKKILAKEKNIPKINIDGEEFINKDLFQKIVESSTEYKKHLKKEEMSYSLSFILITITLIIVIIAFKLGFGNFEECVIFGLIVLSLMLIPFYKIQENYAEINNVYKYFITQNEDKIYIKIKDIKEFIKLYKIENLNIQENMEEEMLKPILIDNKLISENKYNLRTKELSKINVLLDEISKRELDKDNPIIYNYYLPELIEFERSYYLLDEEGKEGFLKAVTLMENKLKEILDEDRNQKVTDLKAKIEAFNNSFY